MINKSIIWFVQRYASCRVNTQHIQIQMAQFTKRSFYWINENEKKSCFKLVWMQMTNICIINREIVVQQWEIFNRNIQYIIKQKVGVLMKNIDFIFLQWFYLPVNIANVVKITKCCKIDEFMRENLIFKVKYTCT